MIDLYGEERFAGPIARAIVARRAEKPFATTGDLADLVASVVPRNKRTWASTPRREPSRRFASR